MIEEAPAELTQSKRYRGIDTEKSVFHLIGTNVGLVVPIPDLSRVSARVAGGDA